MAQIHRFYDAVACSIGDGSTCYMGPKEACKIARALIKAAQSVVCETFGQSQGLAVVVDIGEQTDTAHNPKHRKQERKAKR
jgi:hypothetical protein